MTLGMQQTQVAAQDKPNVNVTLNQFHNEFNLLRDTLSKTMSALDAVKAAGNENGDLTKPYAAFSSSYAELSAQVDKVRAQGTAAKARAKDHYDAWQRELTEMQNPKLREKAQKRFAATQSEFEKINEKVASAKESFAPLAADMKDIDTYLKTDLSKDAVSSLSGTIWKMGNQAKNVDGKLADVCKQIEKTMAKMPQT
jgi:predicted  nucleic acid-binding Zn-ribbon protein